MAKDPLNELAWPSCDFCSAGDLEILTLIRAKAWAKLPLQHSCAWSRICTVAARERMNVKETKLWAALCSARAEVNHEAGPTGSQSSWREKSCTSYASAKGTAAERSATDRGTTDRGKSPAKSSEVKPKTGAVASPKAMPCWFGSFDSDGVPVSTVARGTPAYVAGLRAFDVIVAVNGKPVRHRGEFDALVAKVAVGQAFKLAIHRDGLPLQLELTRGA